MKTMLQGVTKVAEYRSKLPQPLRNVANHQPSLIRVIQGTKQLVWGADIVNIHAGQLIMLPAGQAISFVNQPNNGFYRAQQMLLPNELPAQFRQMLADNVANYPNIELPIVTMNQEIDFTWNSAYQAITSNYNEQIRLYYCYSLLLAMKSNKTLGYLYPRENLSLAEQVIMILQRQPDKNWLIDDIAMDLAMSASTLRRGLPADKISFRQLLTEFRLGNALELMQQRRFSLYEITLRCGYQTQSKFSARFKQQFGITPAEYCKTL